MPDIADLKGRNPSGDVVLAIAISKTGEVTHAHAVKSDSVLSKRSEDAALKWHYKPFVLNGIPLEFDTMLTFRFKKNKVEVVVPPR